MEIRSVKCFIISKFRKILSVCSADISAKYHTTKHDRYPIGEDVLFEITVTFLSSVCRKLYLILELFYFLSDVHSWFFLYEPSDKLHLAALNPPAQFQKLNRSIYFNSKVNTFGVIWNILD